LHQLTQQRRVTREMVSGLYLYTATNRDIQRGQLLTRRTVEAVPTVPDASVLAVSEEVSGAAKKGTKMAGEWAPPRGAVRSQPFPFLRVCCPERPCHFWRPFLHVRVDENSVHYISLRRTCGKPEWTSASSLLGLVTPLATAD